MTPCDPGRNSQLKVQGPPFGSFCSPNLQFADSLVPVSALSAIAAALDPVLLMQSAGQEADPWQANLLRSYDKRSLVLCSRQAGKSTVAEAMAVHEARFRPKSLTLLLSPSQRQSGELFRKVLDVYKASGAAVPVKAESALKLELANGSRVIALPAGEETIRGFSGVSLLIIDEASRVDDELYYSVRPMLAVSGGRLVALTTPFGAQRLVLQRVGQRVLLDQDPYHGYRMPAVVRRDS